MSEPLQRRQRAKAVVRQGIMGHAQVTQRRRLANEHRGDGQVGEVAIAPRQVESEHLRRSDSADDVRLSMTYLSIHRFCHAKP